MKTPTALASVVLLVIPAPALAQEAPQDRAPVRQALEDGYAWLAAHQQPDGPWLAPGNGVVRATGVTALALLAFHANGETPAVGPHRRSVAAGLEWLLQQQDEDTGALHEPGHTTGHYDHAIGTLALLRMERVSPDPAQRAACKRALNYIHKARNPYGAWRYDYPPLGENDTSVTAWMVLALAEARAMDFLVDDEAFQGAVNWFEEVTDPATGRVGYDQRGSGSSRIHGINDHLPSDRGEAMTAAALYARLAMGTGPKQHPILEKQATLLLKRRPEPEMPALQADMYYWYFGSQAMQLLGGHYAQRWGEARDAALVASQVREGEHAGSWAPDGPWGLVAGRAYATSVALLALSAPSVHPAATPAKERELRSDVTEAPSERRPHWSSRRGDERQALLASHGQPGQGELQRKAVTWLAANQQDDGSWATPPRQEQHRIGVTGLATLALLADGHTHRQGEFKLAVGAALRYLAEQQDPGTGLLGEAIGHTFLYSHALGTLALVDAYAGSGDPALREAAQAALFLIFSARNPYGAWRYDLPPVGDNDTSISAWMALAVVNGQRAGLKVDLQAYEGFAGWLDKVTDEEGRVGYDAPGSTSSRIPGINEQFAADNYEGMTAAGLLFHQLTGRSEDALIARQRRLVAAKPPRWGEQGLEADWISWFWGSYALRQEGGTTWAAWNERLVQTLSATQARDGHWPAQGPWAYAGGEAMSTALGALVLAAPFRLEPPLDD